MRRGSHLPALCAVALLLVAGCSDDAATPTTSTSLAGRSTSTVRGGGDDAVVSVDSTGDPDGPACRNSAAWAARSLDQIESLSPTDLTSYVHDWKGYAAAGTGLAPPELAGAWLQYGAAIVSLEQSLSARGNDIARVLSEDPAGAALLGDTTPDYLAEISSWEQQVCGVGDQPITDAAPSGSTNLCDALRPLIDAQDAASTGASTPTQIEAVGSAYRALAATPPTGSGPVVADIARVATWMSEHYAARLQSLGWDLRRFYREAPGVDRLAASGWSPEIRDAVGRVNAFGDEACAAPPGDGADGGTGN